MLGLFLAGGAAQAALITIPASSLNNSPGVYTAGGYYTDTLGPNIVTTDGGNAANIGQADGRNDDGFMSLSLGFNVTFFGTTYNSLYINNNGNVTLVRGSPPTSRTVRPAPASPSSRRSSATWIRVILARASFITTSAPTS
jgi:hypothetical protein